MRALMLMSLVACVRATQAPVVEVSAAHPAPAAPSLGAVEPLVQSRADVREAKNPFEPNQIWEGRYLCAQGETALMLRILEVSANELKARFEFAHEESGVSGSYDMSGRFDPRSGRVTFTPDKWVQRPPSYVSVGMSGAVREKVFSGRIDHETCGEFSVTLGEDEGWDED